MKQLSYKISWSICEGKLMPKKHDETNIQYKNRVIDSVSDSFCAAKWLNATIWLNNGTTASCHHPPAHGIIDFENGESFDDLKKNPSMIHNTTYKKQVRKQMLLGERPKECEYCWKIEDIGNDQSQIECLRQLFMMIRKLVVVMKSIKKQKT